MKLSTLGSFAWRLHRIRPHFEASSWQAFERVWLEHRSAAEAADELSMSIEAVYMAKSRILRRLEEEVQDIAEDFSWLDALEDFVSETTP